jgi:hypothetical protein
MGGEGMATKDEGEKTRATHKIFDLTIKYLFREASSGVIVDAVNALLDKQHPTDSNVSFKETESVADRGSGLENFRSDFIIGINDKDYVIEVQIGNDNTMGIRIFEYGFAHASRKADMDIKEGGALIEIDMPDGCVIFLETTRTTPDRITLRLKAPDGRSFDYDIKVFKMPEQSLESLEAKKLLPLLPFCILQFNKELEKKSLTPEERRALAESATRMIDDLKAALARSREKGLVNDRDCVVILESAARLYKEIYFSYSEFKEGNNMLEQTIGSRLRAVEQQAEFRLQAVESRLQAAESRFQAAEQHARQREAEIFALFRQGHTPEEVESIIRQKYGEEREGDEGKSEA